ncbi:MAG: hypothetical protein AB1298_01125, partial [Bacteroidota bacterium]
IILLYTFISSYNFAQEDTTITLPDYSYLNPGQTNFLLRGYAHSGLEVYKNRSTFVGGTFNPLLLWQTSDRLIFEGEIEVELAGNQTTFGLEYANMAYILNDKMTLRLGFFLLPFGIYGDRLHPQWINPFPSSPLGFSHATAVGPTSDLGIELRGGLQLGDSKMNYSFYVVNGPSLNDGSMNFGDAGVLHFNNFDDNNSSKAVGGRLGFLPINNSSLELGFSGYYAGAGNKDSEYENVKTFMYALDISYIESLEFLSSIFKLKGQYNSVNVDRARFFNLQADVFGSLSFDNKSSAYFIYATLNPASSENEFMKNLEFAIRYSSVDMPDEAPWGIDQTQWVFGINYWIDWRTVLKIAYQIDKLKSQSAADALLVHWSFGF